MNEADASSLAATLIQWTAVILLAALVYAVVFAASLMVIARKLGRRDGWMAWVPVANAVLFCRLANRSLGWIIALLIPVLNLVAAVLFWGDIARARHKSPWVGALFLVPLVNLVVPIYIASGPSTGAASSRGAAGAAAADRCPRCGAGVTSRDKFCGECGAAIAMRHAAMPATPAAAPGRGGRGWFIALGAVVVLAGGGWAAYAWLTSYSAPARKPPALPSRVRGIIKEFPVDDLGTSRASPTSVITQTFDRADRAADIRVPKSWLPPGVEPKKLPEDATALVAAAYRVTPSDPPVGVTVMETRETPQPGMLPSVPREMARAIARTTGGSETGVAVERPNDDIYRGSKISTPDGGVAYVLAQDAAPVMVVIYAPDAATRPLADRLAANVGNGEGLDDYDSMKGALWTLPAEPAPDLTLREVITQTPDEIGLSAATLSRGSQSDAQSQQMLAGIAAILPARFTAARYTDARGREWDALVLDYASGGRAWRTWQMLRWTVGAMGMTPVQVGGGDGRYVDSGRDRILVFHRGAYLVVLGGPAAEPLARLTQWAGRFQM